MFILRKQCFLLILALLFITAYSCRKENAPDQTTLSFIFQNQAESAPVELNGREYTNANGNKFTFGTLKYYISNITLVQPDGKETHLNNYSLVNALKPGTEVLRFDSIPNGIYSSVRFLLGVDSLHNHDGDQPGDLDPVNGMLWSWNTGYIFFEHTGTCQFTTGESDFLIFHYGTDEALVQVELPLANLEMSGTARKIYLTLDFDKLYGSPNIMNFDVDNVRQSASSADRDWLARQKQNFPGAFSIDRTE